MRHTEPDATLPDIDEILLIKQIYDVEAQQKLLSMPGQGYDMGKRQIINGIGGTVG